MKRFIESFLVIVLAIVCFLIVLVAVLSPEANAQVYGEGMETTPGGKDQYCRYIAYPRVNTIDNSIVMEYKKECRFISPFGGVSLGPGHYPHRHRGPTKAQKILGGVAVGAGAAIEIIEILR